MLAYLGTRGARLGNLRVVGLAGRDRRVRLQHGTRLRRLKQNDSAGTGADLEGESQHGETGKLPSTTIKTGAAALTKAVFEHSR
jgi:hypothetical protein